MMKYILTIFVTLLLALPALFATTAFAAGEETQRSVNKYLSIGGRAFKREKYEEAKEAYNKVLELDSNNVEALRNLGVLFSSQGDTASAMRYLNEAFKLAPNDAEVRNNLGVLFSEAGNSARAITHFSAAVEFDSSRSIYMRSLGNEYAKIGRLIKAETLLVLAGKINARDGQIDFSLANVFSGQKKYDSAVTLYLSSIEKGYATDELYYFLGTVERNLGKHEDGLKHFEEALKLNPRNIPCLQSAGILYAAQRKYAAAASKFEAIVDIDSTFYPAWVSLGASYYLMRNFAQADTVLYNLNKVDTIYGNRMKSIIAIETEALRQDAEDAAEASQRGEKK